MAGTSYVPDGGVARVVAVQGNCLGGGFELALRCDIIVAAENARFRSS